MKRVVVTLFTLILSINSFAQGSTGGGQSFWSDPLSHSLLPLYVISALVVIVVFLAAVVAIYMIKILNLLTSEAEKHKVAKLGIEYVSKPTWWDNFLQSMNAWVPVDQEKTIVLDHDYDGIKELDNHLPPWWKWLFIATIVWSAIYIFVFHISNSLPLQLEEYQTELIVADEQVRRLRASQPLQEIDENTLAFTLDSISFITNGKAVFMDNNCGSCHRNDGGGNMIGPNLTDEYWLHGGSIKEVFSIVKNGVVEKGMPAWGKLLSPQQVRDVTFFVLSLQGTNPQDAKKPQGDLYKEEVIQSDSLSVQASL